MERVTRKEIAKDLSERTGVSKNISNQFLIDMAHLVSLAAFQGVSVDVFGVCKIQMQDYDSYKGEKISTGYLASNLKSTDYSNVVAEMLEYELHKLIVEYLNNGIKVVMTEMFSIYLNNGRVYCASSSALRGSRLGNPLRCYVDLVFKRLIINKGKGILSYDGENA